MRGGGGLGKKDGGGVLRLIPQFTIWAKMLPFTLSKAAGSLYSAVLRSEAFKRLLLFLVTL